ncbi:MAG: iron-containing alcohol dehydrogenase [bacterium]|nr:iron-containing alcohol dehydrogenase [bacterium]
MATQDPFSFFAPARLIAGRGTISSIPETLSSRPEKKALLVTDKGLMKAGLVEKITAILDTAGLSYAIYDGVKENPSIPVVQACFDRYQSEHCDWFLAVGGGSSMDTAKAAGVLASNGGKIEDYFGLNKVKTHVPFLLCVPTTYGTASEVTPFAVVTDNNHFKASIGSPEIIPHIGILDSDMAVALPMPIAAATGMDALTHAIESCVALTSNPIAEGLALHAIRLISQYLRQAASSDHNHEATLQMLIASTLAGLAFSQTRLGNVHAMSHTVGGHYGVPHGVANAILLPRVMNFNRIACPEAFGRIAEAMGEDIVGLSPIDAADLAIEAVQCLSTDVGIPDKLSDVGAKPEGIPILAEDAMKSGNVHINPRKTTLEDIVRLFEESM